jgi:hypothetical protein
VWQRTCRNGLDVFRLEVDNQRCSEAAIEGEFGPALQIALQDRSRSALGRHATSLPDHNRVVLNRHLTEPQTANRRQRAVRGAQLS